MSGPVPSPSMKGRMGGSGTLSLPPEMVMGWPAGALMSLKVGVDIWFLFEKSAISFGRGDGTDLAGDGKRDKKSEIRSSKSEIMVKSKSFRRTKFELWGTDYVGEGTRSTAYET